MDFVHDQLATGRKIRVLTVVDIFSPIVDPRFSEGAEDAAATLEKVSSKPGYRKTTGGDQGGEFVSRDSICGWCGAVRCRVLARTRTQAVIDPMRERHAE